MMTKVGKVLNPLLLPPDPKVRCVRIATDYDLIYYLFFCSWRK